MGAVFAAVHGDEDGHGNQREFPEAVVEHQVERDEDAEHGGLLDQEERVEDLAALFDGVPTGEHADGREQADEDDEPEAEAVDADVVEDGGARSIQGRLSSNWKPGWPMTKCAGR